jgi:Ca-activated chloride channel family protein
MSFAAPLRLVAAVVPLGLLAWYLLARYRREQVAVRFSALSTAMAAGPGRGWRRHLSAGLALLGLLAMVVAFARPTMAIPVPIDQATVVLAMDVSLSMEADDVDPSRLEAAQDAARRFLALAPSTLRVGLVAFAGTALPVTGPTDDRVLLGAAVDRLGLGEGTAVGEAIFAALDEIAGSAPPDGAPAAIVVLSDGETTMGRPDAEAAAAAVEAGIPVYTIAFGTQRGLIEFQGEIVPVPVNEGALADVAAATGGEFFAAASESELRRVFDELESQIAFEVQDREVTDWMAAAGLVVLAAAVGLSIRWFDRVA